MQLNSWFVQSIKGRLRWMKRTSMYGIRAAMYCRTYVELFFSCVGLLSFRVRLYGYCTETVGIWRNGNRLIAIGCSDFLHSNVRCCQPTNLDLSRGGISTCCWISELHLRITSVVRQPQWPRGTAENVSRGLEEKLCELLNLHWYIQWSKETKISSLSPHFVLGLYQCKLNLQNLNN